MKRFPLISWLFRQRGDPAPRQTPRVQRHPLPPRRDLIMDFIHAHPSERVNMVFNHALELAEFADLLPGFFELGDQLVANTSWCAAQEQNPTRLALVLQQCVQARLPLDACMQRIGRLYGQLRNASALEGYLDQLLNGILTTTNVRLSATYYARKLALRVVENVEVLKQLKRA